MKRFHAILGVALSSTFISCAWHPVVLSPVGPNPARYASGKPIGELEVFSRLQGESEGGNPSWHQYSDYYIYDARGNKKLERVDNSIGHYSKTPRIVNLPPGNYVIQAMAKDYTWVRVPVAVEAGKTTRVHLDSDWTPPGGTHATEIVSVPGGYAVGWSSGATRR